MFDTLASLRRNCEQTEAALLALMQQIADRFAPPFSPRLRAEIGGLVDQADVLRLALTRHYAFHLHTPEARSLPIHAPDRRYFQAVQRHLRLWPAAIARLRTALRQRPLPLLPPAPPPYGPEAQSLALQSRLWDRLHAHLSPTPPNLYHAAPGHHGDLSYPTTDFLRYAMAARRIALAQDKTDSRFLDIGCGVGLKVFQAAELFVKADGLEYEAAHASAAQDLLHRGGWPQARIYHADALQFDQYGAYDVLYLYKPMYGDPLLALESRIISQARDGTLLIAPYTEFTTRFEDLGCLRIDGFLYMIRPPHGLPKLLRRARQVGCALPAQPKTGYAEDGFLAPLHLALRRWGHGD